MTRYEKILEELSKLVKLAHYEDFSNYYKIRTLIDELKSYAQAKTPRFVYKESYETGKKVKVGILDIHDRIVLSPPKDITIYSPTLYSTDWYAEPKGYEGTEQYLGFESENNIQEIVVNREELGLVNKVTGYITKEGKAIYYDQYNW